ncbi:hypothetical protein HDV05_004849 [Chytridiales sp. JEL 0842]|nr:hypothetical protein HDV05_004849 [Chytridiales sp. JEL 0842]
MMTTDLSTTDPIILVEEEPSDISTATILKKDVLSVSATTTTTTTRRRASSFDPYDTLLENVTAKVKTHMQIKSQEQRKVTMARIASKSVSLKAVSTKTTSTSTKATLQQRKPKLMRFLNDSGSEDSDDSNEDNESQEEDDLDWEYSDDQAEEDDGPESRVSPLPFRTDLDGPPSQPLSSASSSSHLPTTLDSSLHQLPSTFRTTQPTPQPPKTKEQLETTFHAEVHKASLLLSMQHRYLRSRMSDFPLMKDGHHLLASRSGSEESLPDKEVLEGVSRQALAGRFQDKEGKGEDSVLGDMMSIKEMEQALDQMRGIRSSMPWERSSESSSSIASEKDTAEKRGDDDYQVSKGSRGFEAFIPTKTPRFGGF